MLLSAALLTVTALAGGTAHAATPVAGAHAVAQPGVVVRDDLRAVFDKAGLRGTFALLDVRSGRTTVVDRSRAYKPMAPASTFKIPHAVIALETGAVKDEHEIIPYGGKPQSFPQWEQDMNLGDAIKVSNVPVFQTIARRIGLKKEKQWVNRLGYGDREIGRVVDRFWLDGPLEISAVEQTKFLSKFARQQLPATKKSLRLVRDMLKVEQKDGYTLYAKSGWADTFTPGIGWYVGWIERGDRLYAFALNADIVDDADVAARVPVTRDLLTRLGALPG